MAGKPSEIGELSNCDEADFSVCAGHAAEHAGKCAGEHEEAADPELDGEELFVLIIMDVLDVVDNLNFVCL